MPSSESSDVAIVTGASTGLGSEIAALLRERRMRVIGVARRGGEVRGNAAHRATAEKAVEEARRAGSLRVLVNCAGAGIFGAVGTYTDDSTRATLDANLVSMIAFTDCVLPAFMRDGGTIVNVLSTAAMIGKANESVYCAAKWGARGYTEAIRAEAKSTKARIMAVYPGGMNTPFWDPPRTSFMDAREVATMIVDAMFQPETIYVSDLVIQRP